MCFPTPCRNFDDAVDAATVMEMMMMIMMTLMVMMMVMVMVMLLALVMVRAGQRARRYMLLCTGGFRGTLASAG